MLLHARQYQPRGARSRRLVALAAALVAVAACSNEPTGAKPPPAPPSAPALARGGKSVPGTIAYSFGFVDTDASIYAINPDGTGLTRITDAAEDQNPAWSPDYRKLAIERGIGSAKIVVRSVNGKGETVLGSGRGPAWSPDGSRIAFTNYVDDNYDVYVMNANGTGLERLTTDGARDGSPHWSPDGQRIAFVSDRSGSQEVWVMNADGSGQSKVTSCGTGYFCTTPRWSPVMGDDRILYRHYWDGTSAPFNAIEIIASDGTGLTTVLSETTLTSSAAWSPDAQRIAFVGMLHGQNHFDIYAMKANGTEISRVTVNKYSNARSPAWAR